MRHALKNKRLVEKLNHELGAPILAYLADPDILEIMLNPDGQIWIDRSSQGVLPTNDAMDILSARQLLGTLADFAGVQLTQSTPVLETTLPFQGYRFEGMIPPIVKAPCFVIRKFCDAVITLNDYVAQQKLSHQQLEGLRRSIQARESILIVGGPGTGKTTFANALLQEMISLGGLHQRFVIIEDTPELKCVAPNTLFLKTSHDVNHEQLLKVALRSRPDKICLGECRGKEILTLLAAWNTGTPGGLATLHSNDATSALIRIHEMAQQSVSPYFICESIKVIVSLSFDPVRGRCIQEIKRLTGIEDDGYVFEEM